MQARTTWLVEYLAEAVLDLQAIEIKTERTGVLNVIDKLVALGPSLAPRHMKPFQGEPNLMELRPRQGSSPVRSTCASPTRSRSARSPRPSASSTTL
jgi:hypothetical protein